MSKFWEFVATWLAIVVAGTAVPAVAQPELDALVERIQSVELGSTTAEDCAAQMRRTDQLNSADMFFAAAVCLAAEQKVEGSFLMVAGQVRATADLFLIVPEAKADADAGTALYGFIYSFFGGVGDQEVFRRPSEIERLFSLLDAWSPAYGPDYDPGWNERRRPDAAEYRQVIAEVLQDRRRQLVDFARLYRDDEYYALSRELDELGRRNSGSLVDGTPDGDRGSELFRLMEERTVALGFPPRPAAPEPEDPSEHSTDDPPDAAEAQEVAITDRSDPVVRRCAEMTERWTIGDESRLVGLSISRHPRWGVIWRADLLGPSFDGAEEVTRVTCAEGYSSTRPLDMGEDDNLAPLPPVAPDTLEALVG